MYPSLPVVECALISAISTHTLHSVSISTNSSAADGSEAKSGLSLLGNLTLSRPFLSFSVLLFFQCSKTHQSSVIFVCLILEHTFSLSLFPKLHKTALRGGGIFWYCVPIKNADHVLKAASCPGPPTSFRLYTGHCLLFWFDKTFGHLL